MPTVASAAGAYRFLGIPDSLTLALFPRRRSHHSTGVSSVPDARLVLARCSHGMDPLFDHRTGDTGVAAGSSAIRQRSWTVPPVTRMLGAAAAASFSICPTYCVSKGSSDARNVRSFARSSTWRVKTAPRVVRTRAVARARRARMRVSSGTGRQRF